VAIFIAVAAVLIVLNLFFVFIIRALGARIGNFAQNNMLRQSSVFDELILRKEESLQGLLKSIETAELRYRELTDIDEARADFGVPLEHHAVTPGDYMDPFFSQDYKQIRENFIFNKESLLRKLIVFLKVGEENPSVDAARRITESVDTDTCYLLSTLPADEQLNALEDAFDEQQKILLRAYTDEHESFEGFEFIAWLQEYIFINGGEVIVRTGMKSDNFDAVDSHVKTEYDDSLIEGMYVIYKGQMYDYSIRSKEISG
jgi:hypothetical protein